MADIVHPNLVTLFDLLQADDGWFVTMEYIDGVDLLTHLRKSETRAVEEAGTPGDGSGLNAGLLREVFGQLVSGVMALHERGVLHRDLKPSNVLVTEDDRVVVLDFGLAIPLFVADPGQSVHLVGTLAYAAPEQAAGQVLSRASDWYGVGVMLYEALVGRCPFEGAPIEVLEQKERAQPIPPSAVRAGIPAELEQLSLQLLARDPDRRPQGAEILDRLKGVGDGTTPRSTGRSTPSSPIELVGRRAIKRRLREDFSQVMTGQPAIVLLRGASGAGKTALARDFLAKLRLVHPEAVLLRGRCYEQEILPYKALDSLVDDLSRYLSRLPEVEVERVLPRGVRALARVFPVLLGISAVARARPGDGEIDDRELRQRAALALREMLARIGDRYPVVLFIDDVQWGDVDSIAFFEELVRAPDAPVLMLLVAYRSEREGASPLLGRMREWGRDDFTSASIRTVEVDDLSHEETLELARTLLEEQGAPSEAEVERIALESEGNPFFLTELALHVSDQTSTDEPAGLSLEAMIRSRVSALPEDARRLLEVVAVTGQPVDIAIAQKAAGLGRLEDPAISTLRQGKLLRTRTEEGRLEIEAYHDRVRETLKNKLSDSVLQSIHRRLASAWESSGRADLETLAVHWQGGGDIQRASRYASQAADEAAHALAFDRAARLYRQALEYYSRSTIEARPLRVKLGHALANAGRGAEAAEAYLRASEGAGPEESLDLRRQAADQQLSSGHVDAGLETIRTVLAMVGTGLPASPRRALAALFFRRLQLWARGLRYEARVEAEVPVWELARIDTFWSVARGLIMVDSINAAHFQSLHLLAALRTGERKRIARALAVEASAVLRGRQNQLWSARVIRVSREIASQLDDPYLLGVTKLAHGAEANFHGRFPEALALCLDADATFRQHCIGATWELDTAQLYRLHSLYWLGAWGELSRILPSLRREAELREDLYLATYMGVRVAHAVHLANDQPEAAREDQRRSIAAWSPVGFQTQHYWDWFARTEIDLFEGKAIDAWARVEERWPMHLRSLLHRHQALYIEALCMRARACVALACEKPARDGRLQGSVLLRRAQHYARSIERQNIPWGNALATMVRAGAAITQGDAERARALTRLAAEAFAALEMKLHLGVALYRHASIVGGGEGEAERERAEQLVAGRGVRNLPAVARMLAPGAWSD